MTLNSKLLLAVAVVALGAVLTYVQFSKTEPGGTAGMDHSAMTSTQASETQASETQASDSNKGYQAAMDTMMKGMMAPMTGKPELDFVQGMMPHHQGAIDMAKVALQYGKDPDIKKLAEGVIKAQENEIGFMKEWLAKSNVAALPTVPASLEINKKAMETMMKNMTATYTGNADVDFVKGMIPHHQGAIDMAKAALQFVKDPALLKLAQDIVSAQEGEITFMTDWLKKNGQ